MSPCITKNVNNKVSETETIGEQYNGKVKYSYTCFPHALENEKLIASAMTRTRTRVQNVNFSCWLQKSFKYMIYKRMLNPKLLQNDSFG